MHHIYIYILRSYIDHLEPKHSMYGRYSIFTYILSPVL